MRRSVASVAAALTLGLAACDDAQQTPIIPGPGPSKVQVDTADLRALKARIGMQDCPPGPGGGDLPDLTLKCLGGGTSVDLKSLRGPLVLSLWQAGCEPCRKEMPALQDFVDQYGERVPVLGIDFADQYPGSALQQAGKRGVTYPSLADPGGDMQGFDEFAKIPGLPTMYFIDQHGKIAYQRSFGVDSAGEVADLVKQHLGVDLTTGDAR